MYIYHNKEGKQTRIKEFTSISDMFHWCELNCKRIKGNYYMNGNLILCKLKERRHKYECYPCNLILRYLWWHHNLDAQQMR